MPSTDEASLALDEPWAPRGRQPDLSSLTALWAQAAALLVILLGILLFVDNGHIAVPDEGVYLAQAENLSNGSWSRDRPATDVDPNGIFTPVTDSGVIGDRVIAYYKHPLYPVILTPFFAAAGTVGALALSVLGTWGAAVAAAFLARRLKTGYGPFALWIVGLGSPLFFDAYISVAHSVAAAFAGLCILGLSRAIDDHRAVPLAYALPSAALVVALRGEGLILIGATGITIGFMALGWPPLRRVDWRAGFTAVAVVLVGGVTYALDRLAAHSIAGSGTVASPLQQLSSKSRSPLGGAWASLARPFTSTWLGSNIYVVFVVLCIVLAAVTLRLMPRRTLAPLLLLVGAAAAAIGSWFSSPLLVTGLFAAFPLLLAGIVGVRAIDLRSPLVARSLGIAAIAGVVTVVGNYSIGGAAEWGGRFYHLLIPLLVPVVVLGLDNSRRHLGRREAAVALACLTVATLSMSLLALRENLQLRETARTLAERSVEYSNERGTDLLIISRLFPDGSGRIFWETTSPDVLTSYDLAILHRVIRSADNAGRESAVIATNISPMLFDMTMGETFDATGWTVQDHEVVGNFTLAYIEKVDSPMSPP